MIRLILGGDKSGKSAHALRLLEAGPAPRRLAVTGRALDAAFREQIAAHKRERSPLTPVVECGPDLAGVLAAMRLEGGSILADSLDFWLFSCLEAGDWPGRRQAFLACLEGFRGPLAPELTLVSAEAGLGPVAASSAARRFVRELGALNQAVAALAEHVVLVAAGLPLVLKGGAP